MCAKKPASSSFPHYHHSRISVIPAKAGIQAPRNPAVVAWSPDHATLPTAGLLPGMACRPSRLAVWCYNEKKRRPSVGSVSWSGNHAATEAGIQVLINPHCRHCRPPSFPRRRESRLFRGICLQANLWIPAFAGMTCSLLSMITSNVDAC